MSVRTRNNLGQLGLGGALAWLAVAMPALAQYKVVGPDGRVTYTDRPPVQGRVTAVSARGAASGASGAAESTLPAELRQPVARYPVVLYTVAGTCSPCAGARQLLRARGVPFNEKQLLSPEDGDALERLTGGRDAPTLAIGNQSLRGLAPEVWTSYLDAAGYPRESRLPPGYAYPAPTPVVDRRDPAAARAASGAASDAESRAAAPAVQPAGGIKF